MKTAIKNICVYCGSNFGERNSYRTAACALADEMVALGITLIYGGGNVGLMGVLADSLLSAGGQVIGVIPQALVDKEVAHTGLSDLRIVGSMHERKSMMADLADAFIALPGGLGTLEEFCEVATWAQLGLHRKACGVLNVEGYYDGLLAMLDHATEEKFIRPEHRMIILSETDPRRLIKKLAEYEPPMLHKWLERDQQ
jgi:uncharacterized protein (TIGR00730 family)